MRSTLVDDEAAREESPAPPQTDPQRSVTRSRALVLLAAFVSFLFSVSLYFWGNEQEGIFVGIWVPSILALGAFLFPRGAR